VLCCVLWQEVSDLACYIGGRARGLGLLACDAGMGIIARAPLVCGGNGTRPAGHVEALRRWGEAIAGRLGATPKPPK
jgi:hypothetical protein